MASNPTLRRLMKEAHELSAASSSPSPYFYAHPASGTDFFDWHFTLAGPPSSPYTDGIYHGRIVLPPTYPLRPPSFRFLTPSGRFEVNREICLSISGHHEETWQPAWGIRTALIALRSYMAADAAGQVGGMETKEEVRREWARRSRAWSCESCSGGKTNEEVLEEWREACRGKGVDNDEGEANAKDTPDGLEFGYKDEQGSVQDTNLEGETNTANLKTANETELDSTALSAAQTLQQPYVPRPETATSSRIPPPSPSSAPTPSPTTPLTTATDRPTASRLDIPATAPQEQHRQHPATRQTVIHQSPDSTAWMDKAIPVLVIALVIMVIKNWILPLVA